MAEDRDAGMAPGPGGGHEHIHCSLKPLDPSLVPEQVAAGGTTSSRGEALDRPLAVVAAKYYFNGDSNVVFRYRLYSFHLCPVSSRVLLDAAAIYVLDGHEGGRCWACFHDFAESLVVLSSMVL